MIRKSLWFFVVFNLKWSTFLCFLKTLQVHILRSSHLQLMTISQNYAAHRIKIFVSVIWSSAFWQLDANSGSHTQNSLIMKFNTGMIPILAQCLESHNKNLSTWQMQIYSLRLVDFIFFLWEMEVGGELRLLSSLKSFYAIGIWK